MVVTSANVKYYAQIVADKATLRRLISINEEIANICYAGKEPTDVILEETEKKYSMWCRSATPANTCPSVRSW